MLNIDLIWSEMIFDKLDDYISFLKDLVEKREFFE